MRRETLDAVTPFVLYHGWISEVIHPVRAGPVLEGRLERPYRFQPPTPRASRARPLVFIRFRQLDEYRSIFRGKTLLPFPSPLDLLVIIRFSFKKIEPKCFTKKCRWIVTQNSRDVLVSALPSLSGSPCSDASIIDCSKLNGFFEGDEPHQPHFGGRWEGLGCLEFSVAPPPSSSSSINLSNFNERCSIL